METAVDIPDELFREAERAAEESGMTRSGLYAEALRRFLKSVPAISMMSGAEITARLNAVYADDPGHLDPVIEALQFEALANDDWPEEAWERDIPHTEVTFGEGEIWRAQLRSPLGSEPGFERPVVVVQADAFNESAIATVICVVFTTNLARRAGPGNVLVPHGTAASRAIQ